MRDLNKAQRHLRRRDDYYNNALRYIAEGKFSKASELLWGAVTQSLKALAATRDINIPTHAAFFNFTRDLAKELEDEEFHKSFLFLNNLHKNFYDEAIDPKDFQLYRKEAELFLRKVEEIGKRIEE
ncbi:MAG: PaREP1 family protein [Candidatus Methanospirareceae archaeon]